MNDRLRNGFGSPNEEQFVALIDAWGSGKSGSEMTLRFAELGLTIAPKMERDTPTETVSVKPADLPNTSAQQRSMFPLWMMGK